MPVTLGIDIGTSGTKTLAVGEDGTVRADASAEYPLATPRPGWTEQDPADWWDATVETVKRVLKTGRLKPDDVAGIGLSGQMHGSVFLDRSDAVVRPALLWNDQRTGAECEEMTESAGGHDELIRMVANPARTGFTAPKILWLRNNEKRNYKQTVRVLLPKDYVRLKLTGEYATEVSDASGTLLLDVANRRWSEELLGKLDLDPALLPPVHESPAVTGGLTDAVARELGLNPGTPVVGGGGDQAAGAVGTGIVRRGAVSAALGTSGVVFAHSDSVQVDPAGRVHTFCHAVPGKWHVMGVVLSAAGSLEWFRDTLCQDLTAEAKKSKSSPFELITAEAATAPAGCEGLQFLPYLTGERCPHFDPDARGAWIGLTRRTDRPAMARAVIEGVTYAMRDNLEVIRGMGVPVRRVRLSGGGGKSSFWRQVQADIYGTPCEVLNAEEGPAFGAALLAHVGTGTFKSVPEACDATLKVVEEVQPDAGAKKVYNARYPRFGRLYAALKEEFGGMG